MKKLLFYYYLFVVFFLSFFVSGVIDSQDGFQYLAVARNIYYKHEPTAPEYEYDERKNIHMATYVKNGKTYTLVGLGFSLAMLPAVAITDFVYQVYNITPPVHFPLENDWLIFLTASFTNIFFAAGLSIVLYLYLREIKLKHKQAIFIAIISIFATNLFAASKHLNAHMMFTFFLVLSFYLLKLYSRTTNKKLLFFSGISFGMVTITYNVTFLLTIPSLIIYYLTLFRPKLSTEYVKRVFIDLILFSVGLLPLALVFIWFENLRSTTNINFTSPSTATNYAQYVARSLPISVFIEGLYGQLLSPGRSIFIYSPLILIIIIFWHKILPRVKPELLVFLCLSFFYIIFYSTTHTIGREDQGIAALWHGESSWGPRYLTTLIPFGMLIVGHIYQKLTTKEKMVTFYPLIIIGLYIQTLGVVMPYQIKFHDLDKKFRVNGTQYTVYAYSNLLPRYTPIFMMSKKLIKLAQSFPLTLNNGKYNVRFYDGVNFPFDVGPERWRVIEGAGYISLDNNNENPIKKLSIDLINHPIETSTASAMLTFSLNGHLLNQKALEIKPTEREKYEFPINSTLLKSSNNQFLVNAKYLNENITKSNKQIIGMISFSINDQEVNKESIDVPYISDLGPKIAGATYKNWGGTNKDPWKSWDIHTQTYERLPDFWWVRNLYYWDVPKKWIISMLGVNIIAFVYFARKLLSSHRYKLC